MGWFARALLEGKALPELKTVLGTDNLKENSTGATHSAGMSKRMTAIVTTLMGSKVASRSTLSHALSRNPKFLYDELQEILVVDVRKAFRSKYESLIRVIK